MSRVILLAAPPTLLRGRPRQAQDAIRSIIGKPLALAGYSHGQAELDFTDCRGDRHSIWVDLSLIGKMP